jgi:hypothetical protein
MIFERDASLRKERYIKRKTKKRYHGIEVKSE